MREQGGFSVQELSSNPDLLARRALISRQGILHRASGGCAKKMCKACAVFLLYEESCCCYCNYCRNR